MSSSDEEGEIVPDCVTNYHFVDKNEEPVSFSVLPLQWKEGEVLEESVLQVFLYATADGGLQQIYKKVIAWKFELSYVLPEIYVLSKDKKWIKLHRPRKSYEDMIKKILVAVHVLHFVKKNPEESGETLWNYILKTFSTYEVLPSENDLLDHVALITEAMQRDNDIAKSKYIAVFLLEICGKGAALSEKNRVSKRSKFIIEDDSDKVCDIDANDCADNEEPFYSVCAYCDDGGEILCCEGRCLRSFHPTLESGTESFCESLGYNREQADAIKTFLCKNCQYQQHQCFACGLLGSSDKSSGAEVFPCVSATCGHFYHPKCVSKLLYPCDDTRAEEHQKKIAGGESFTCPVHICYHCKQVEDKSVFDLQFGICGRCPKAYHRKCLPRAISFGYEEDKNVQRRAWDKLLEGRILIYCMDHKIIPKIGTPRRDHLVFPDADMKKQLHCSQWLPSEVKAVSTKRSKILGSLETKHVVKAKKLVKGTYGTVENVEKRSEKVSEQKMSPSMKSSKDKHKSLSEKVYKPLMAGKGESSLIKDQPKSLSHLRLTSKVQHVPDSKTRNIPAVNPSTKKAYGRQPSGRAEMEKRILALIESSAASFNSKEFIKEKKRKLVHMYSPNVTIGKTITMGKVEQYVEAVRAALKKVEDGGTIEEAKAVCEPEILHQITRWKRKLKVYLGPFLHGMRYTSFGRHFTKVDKLKEVVERLRWYVKDGDTIVDFCCGSNDFSCLMKEVLDKMGRRCSFKNYDLIQPKNDFHFEKRDWMTVGLGELPEGSNLIMGLNPPFGVQASLANKFINKALTFRPKLLILIVPKETERLEKKKYPYDLVWEDDQLLSGKSFYLPGSVDVHDKQLEQWNLDTPPLYLWSRPDWSAKHREIACQRGQIRIDQDIVGFKDVAASTSVSNYLMEDNHDCYGDFSNVMKGYGDISGILDDLPEVFDQFEYDEQPDGQGDGRSQTQWEQNQNE